MKSFLFFFGGGGKCDGKFKRVDFCFFAFFACKKVDLKIFLQKVLLGFVGSITKIHILSRKPTNEISGFCFFIYLADTFYICASLDYDSCCKRFCCEILRDAVKRTSGGLHTANTPMGCGRTKIGSD